MEKKIIDIGFKIDLEKLIDSRMLIQANSGGGKSYAVRKLLEKSYGKVLSIILDVEGEYSSLREKFDFLLIGKNGDIPVNIKAAKLLPQKILELNIPTIIDISELKRGERITYIKYFLEALMSLPKKYWKPCLIAIEESHNYAGQQEKQDSCSAVIDLMTRGRKKGYCGILITQRISKLHKDAAAECNNKIIGKTFLDIDIKRSSYELGFTSKQDMLKLRELKPGTFYAFGTAIEPHQVHKVTIGPTITTHPKVGRSLDINISPPTDKIKDILSNLNELPQEMEKKIKDRNDLLAKIRKLKSELLKSNKTGINKEYVANYNERLREMKLDYNNKINQMKSESNNYKIISDKLQDKLKRISGILDIEIKLPKIEIPKPTITIPEIPFIKEPINYNEQFETNEKITGGAMRMLKSTAMFYPNNITKARIGTLAGLSFKSGSFSTYLATLKRNGLIKGYGNEFCITEKGLELAGDVKTLPASSDELIDMWVAIIKGGAGRILKVLSECYPYGISREELGNKANIVHTSGSFNTYIATLKRNGLIIVESGEVKIANELFENE